MAAEALGRPGSNHISELVTTALRQDRLGGISDMLRCIAELMESDACILWQAIPTSRLDADPPTGHLLALAQWFRTERIWTTHKLPLDSVSGQAVLGRRIEHVDNARADRRVDYSLPFFHRTGVTAFCTVPIYFQNDARGAVNLYRVAARPFQRAERERAKELADLVPSLYQAIRDRVSFNLLHRLDALLQSAEARSSDGLEDVDRVRQTLEEVCRMVGETFQALETSVFLEDRLKAPGSFEVANTTFKKFVTKTSYQKGESGLTPWVLAQGRSVNVFDLACFDEDLPSIVEQYGGISWEDRNSVLAVAENYFQPRLPGELPPISFMCAPVLSADRVLGAIRCCLAVRSPYYFAEREVELLELVATRVGHYWDNWLREREAQEENRSLRTLVAGISTMNRRAQEELLREVPNERALHEEALRVGREGIPAANLLDVVLSDSSAGPLSFSAQDGAGWGEIGEPEISYLKSTIAALLKTLSDAPDSAVAPPIAGSRLLDLFTMPLAVGGSVYGALQMGSTGPRTLPRFAAAIAGLLAEQISLYRHLATTLRDSHEAQKELNNLAERQKQTYEDLGHQMKTPVITAHNLVQSLLTAPLPEKVREELVSLRSLLARAKSVSWSTRLFAELSEKGELSASLRPIGVQQLLALLHTAVGDQQQRLDAAKGMEFRVLAYTFRVLESTRVLWSDLELLEQAISNILDNASKYGAPRSRADVYGGITKNDRFHITVRNKGLRIRPQDVRRCVERGWRGEEAQAVTGEGSGVGLWLADHIMRAHGGELVISPTTKEWVTEVKLILPIKGGSRK